MATTSSFVSIDVVRSTAKSIMEDADTMDRAYFDEWVYLGLGEIGPNGAWISPPTTLYPVNMELLKPKDMYAPISVGLYNSSNQELRYTYRGQGKRVHLSGNNNIDASIYAPEFGAPIDLSEDAYYFYLGSNGTAVSYAKITYLKFPVDELGNMLIPETDVLALAHFVRYMWMMRKNDKQGERMARASWISMRNEARATHRIPSELVATEIARTFNSMIQKMRYKTF